MENYLLRFERIAKTWAWPEEEWAYRLVPLLTGKALEAYSAMDEERSDHYPDLRQALLAKFNISAETYRQRFRDLAVPSNEVPTETYQRLKGLYRRWIKPEQSSVEEIGEAIILEQLLRVLPPEVRTWVKEHEPSTGVEAAKLATQYVNARRTPAARPQRPSSRGDNRHDGPKGNYGTHGNVGVDKNVQPSASQGRSGGSRFGQQANSGRELICYYCQQPGHKASDCPLKKPKLSGYCCVPRKEMSRALGMKSEDASFHPVTVNGVQLLALLDSGSSMSLVKKCYLNEQRIDYGHKTDIECVHGDRKPYPTTEVTIVVAGQAFLLQVGVIANLAVDCILGRDLPILTELIAEQKKCETCAMVTRSQVKAGLEPLPDLDGDLCEGGSKGPRKPRRQRRLEKMEGTFKKGESLKPYPESVDVNWDVPNDIRQLQMSDPSLSPLYKQVEEGEGNKPAGPHFLVENDILYVMGDAGKRLVVPTSCRPLVLHLAHTIPWAGHLGQQKTYTRLGSRFYWPTMFQDVKHYCTTCPECQITTHLKPKQVPLHPLPIISTPFRRIAMDIVGPLEKSSTGYQYILVICDYATRFPEAFPLRSIKTPKIIGALVQLFSRVGIPEEIIHDQGSNFTSGLMKQLNKELGIRGIRTTPYHPETDGLVERFNQTLKQMLRKVVSDTGRDWDKWLPFVLFAYREVPQASTGFSPFELLYGWPVQGPLDLLKKEWEETKTAAPEGILSYVLQMRDRLEKYREEAKVNLERAQQDQKRWYDKRARQRELKPGQQVLLLLPTCSNKLLARWQGPYPVLRKMGPVTYEVAHADKGKATQVYHINLLKEWKEREEPPAEVLLVRHVHEEDGEADSNLHQLLEPKTLHLDHLPSQQQEALQRLLEELPGLLREGPGRTTLTQHTVRLKEGVSPIRQKPYRIPESLGVSLKEEIQKMSDLGVIELSMSEWSSPMVMVPKKDGSTRPCIDFRKVNAVSRFDAYPMPRIDDLVERVGKAKYITTLDLCKGYWQIPMEETSRQYTAFRAPSGLYQFTVMPFGLHGAPATFQRLMDTVLRGMDSFSAAYLDDVVIFSYSWEDHLHHLRQVLTSIERAGLSLNAQKCEWVKSEVQYLGYQMGDGHIRPLVDKVEAIRNRERPRTKRQVRSLLGLLGWYCNFLPHYSTLAAPLTDLTRKEAPNPVKWSLKCEQSFVALKNAMCSFPVLCSPDFQKRFVVQTDASDVGLGAVLLQGDEGEERPVLYLSRKLEPRETRYSTIEKEGLAIKWALESLRYYLLGREFDVETDHRALSWINTMKDRNARITRWYLDLQPFNFRIRHKPGKTNILADYLSRFTTTAAPGEGGGNVAVHPCH